MQTPFAVRRNLFIEVVHNNALTIKYTLEFWCDGSTCWIITVALRMLADSPTPYFFLGGNFSKLWLGEPNILIKSSVILQVRGLFQNQPPIGW